MQMGAAMRFMEPTAQGEALAMELYHYAVRQPDIPDVEMSFSNAEVTAYVDGDQQRTEDITFNGIQSADNHYEPAGWGETS